MTTMASQITSLTVIYSVLYSGVDQRKHQSSASLAFARGIHRGPVNSPRKWPVTRKMFPFDDVIMHHCDGQCLTGTCHPRYYAGTAMHVMMTSLNENNYHVTGPLCGEYNVYNLCAKKHYWWCFKGLFLSHYNRIQYFCRYQTVETLDLKGNNSPSNQKIVIS